MSLSNAFKKKTGLPLPGFSWKYVIITLVLLLTFSSCNYNPGGVSQRVQIPMIGSHWEQVEGYFFTIPFISRTVPFSQKITLAVTTDKDMCDAASACIDPVNDGLPFADTYLSYIEYQMRFSLPSNPKDLENMYQDVRSEKNLIGNTLTPFAVSIARDTTTQMLGTEFAQGGVNKFRTLLEDQAMNGLFVTEVRKEAVKSEQADTDSKRKAGVTASDEQVIRKVVYLEDEDGNKLRRPTSLKVYNIDLVSNSVQVLDTQFLGRLQTYITNKQENIAKQIAQEELQKLNREVAKTKQLEGAKNLVVEQNELNIANEKARLTAEKEEIEARKSANITKINAEKLATNATINANKEADIAKIQKAKELQIAQDAVGISKANLEAAKLDAKAKLQIGLAEAKISKAKYLAIRKEVLEIEADKEKALAMYRSNIRVDMPDFVNMGGANSTGTGLEIMTTMKALEQLQSTK